MTTPRHNSFRAFTIMELLVVISIIAIVAGLIVGLAGMAGRTSKISRTKAENERLVTLINSYQAKLGVYPPANPDPTKPGFNSLLYELAGAIRDTNIGGGNANYVTPFTSVQANTLSASFGVNGIQNAVDFGGDLSQIHRLLKSLRPDQKAQVVAGTLSLVVPVDGLNGQPNAWKYATGTNAIHNPESFDLWVEIVVGGKTNIIGNWKD